MLESLSILRLDPTHYDIIRSVYEACNYHGGIKEADVGFLAKLESEPVAAVRLAVEEDVLLLRGMMVRPEYQRRGIGKEMLGALDRHIGNAECFLVCGDHLRKFYGNIDFHEIEPYLAPAFLRQRAEQYSNESNKRILPMHRAGKASRKGR